MDRNLALEAVRVTEAAALHAARWVGRGDERSADNAAVEAMRKMFSILDIRGRIVIGEGERDEAPMLFIGEEVGTWREGAPELDIAVDPLEGTTITARGDYNAISVLAMGNRGAILNAPDCYMMKLAVGPEAKGVIDLNVSVTDNLKAVAEALRKPVENLTAVVLDRPRHADLIKEIRECGCRIRLIRDGDVAGAVSTATPESGNDILVGIGGAPEGVLAAAALRCVGGDIQGKLVFRSPEERERAVRMGMKDPDRILKIDDMASGDVMFAATGVTGGSFLQGITFTSYGAVSHSVVMRSRTGTIRYLRTEHHFDRRPMYW